MDSTPDITELCAALALAQAELKPAIKNKVNTFFKDKDGKGSKYADLESVMEAIREPLGKNGLSIVQGLSMTPERFVRIRTRLMHKSGQWIEEHLDLRSDKDTPQSVGACCTYGRRFGLSALVGAVTDEDDDGNSTREESPPKNNAPPQQPDWRQAALAEAERAKAGAARRAESEAAQRREAEAAANRKIAFAKKCEDLGIDRAGWAEIGKRLHASNRPVTAIEAVLAEMEQERAAATAQANTTEGS